MDNFIRRLFYDRQSGLPVYLYQQRGWILRSSAQEDLASYPPLHGLTLADVGVMEWFEPDAEVERQFARAESVRVDVSKSPPELIFTVTDAPPDPAEMEAALNILGVETR